MPIEKNTIFSIYIFDYVLKEIREISEKFEYEIFGYLIGELFRWKNKLYIIINEHIFLESGAESTRYRVSQMEGMAGKYEERFRGLRLKRDNQNLRVLGWWHTHPDIGCFLSKTDMSTQRFFFPESYQVALVVDPVRKEYEFFSLDESERGYKVFDYAIIK